MNIGDLLKVTRDEIQDFPGDTIELILELQKEGWRAQRSKRNHVMLLAPDGVTKYSASRNANSAKYLREDIARYKRSTGDGPTKEEEVPKQEGVSCPRPDCPKFFTSLDHLNYHIAVDHEGRLGCPEKDCFETFKRPQALGRHRQLVHGYISPKYAKRKAQEAKRAEKKILDEVVEEVEKGQETIVGSATVFDPPIRFESKDQATESESPQIDREGIANEDESALVALFGLSAEEVYRQTRRAIETARSTEVVRTENDVEFIDNRDSWVIAHKSLRRRRIEDIERTFAAAGLKMEIRVWREEES